ncbi:hypothetical protein pqer_cds_348 [Pandoravirus quercus]|uniref:Uncharacterized protein n=2 Tax=Pandoravirus TaxID=2060084 RepID=A0A2U7U8L8_9VIRU|nr:hypothetical protein pqer_cds_348 [Pandoravirus quercus]AVK74770.1 hypothetical protein pqer_cds_348 [Pandoravirus quercus]QBZ80947.1 hypothetical protein pclt_cds_349 [Pandoravirus celtis]
MSGAETVLAVFALGSAAGAAASVYSAATLWRAQTGLSRAVLAGTTGKITDRAASSAARVLYIDALRPARPRRDRSFRRPVVVASDGGDANGGAHFVRHLAVLHGGGGATDAPLVIDAFDADVDARLRSASRPLWRGGLAQALDRCGLADGSNGSIAIDDGNLYQVSEAPLEVPYCVATVPLDARRQVSAGVNATDPTPHTLPSLPSGQHSGLAFTREAAANAVSRMLAHDALRRARMMSSDCALGAVATCALWGLLVSF